jgi:hypothetical protein
MSSSLSRVAGAAAGQCSNQEFGAVSVANDNNGFEQKCQQQQCHDSDSSNCKAAVTVSSHAGYKRRYHHDLDSKDDNNARSSGGANHGGDNKAVKVCWKDNERHRHHNLTQCNNQQTEGMTRGGASG